MTNNLSSRKYKKKRERQVIIKKFKKQKAEELSLFQNIKALKEVASILACINALDRIPVAVLKKYFKGVSKTFMTVTELYEKEKQLNRFEDQIHESRMKLYERMRRAIKIETEIRKKRREILKEL